MAWNIPDKGTADNDAQSVVYNTDLDVLSAGMSGVDCVLSGLDFTGGADMTPDISKGAVLSNGVMFAVAAASVTHTTADATNPRFDLVVVTSAGALAVRAGTPAASPKPPARTANDVVIRRVYIGAGDTSISTAQSTDMRVFRTQGPIMIGKVVADVTFTSDTNENNYLNVAIPNGMFLTGRQLRCSLRGTINISSSGSATLRIKYGSTTMFSDSTGTMATNVARPWSVDFLIVAQSASSQKMTGSVGISAAFTGGDFGTVDTITSTIGGTAALDSDAADRAVTVTWQMSASSNTITCSHATLELL